jgi:RNA polymerase sigma-70 factor, ECF subfamily
MASDTLRTCALEAHKDSAGGTGSTDTLSVAEVYAANFKFVWRCLRALGVHGDCVDDAVHDVFLVVHRKLPLFDGRAQLRTWLYAIALRVARRYRAQRAKEARRAGVSALETLATEQLEPALPSGSAAATAAGTSHADHGDRLDLARRALAALDDEKREAFVLAYVEQMSAPEIARVTGLPVNTVYSRMRAARLAFSAEVQRLERAHARGMHHRARSRLRLRWHDLRKSLHCPGCRRLHQKRRRLRSGCLRRRGHQNLSRRHRRGARPTKL